jgi:hypothetical protein
MLAPPCCCMLGLKFLHSEMEEPEPEETLPVFFDRFPAERLVATAGVERDVFTYVFNKYCGKDTIFEAKPYVCCIMFLFIGFRTRVRNRKFILLCAFLCIG